MIGKVLKNTVALAGARGIDAIAKMLIIMVITRYLGPEQYGQYAYLTSLVVILVAMSYFGIERITIRNIASNREGREDELGTALVTRWLIFGLAFVLILVLMCTMKLSPTDKKAMLIVTLSQLALSSAQLYGTVFKAYEHMEFDTAISFVFQSLELVLIVAVVHWNLGILAVFGAGAVADALRLLVTVFLCNRYFFKPRLRLNIPRIKELIKDAFILGTTLLLFQITTRVTVFMLEGMRGLAEVSFFYAPRAFLLQLNTIPGAFAMALFPFMSRTAPNDRGAFAYGFEQAFKVTWAATMLFVVAAMSAAAPLTRLMYGPALMASTMPFIVLLPSALFTFVQPLQSFALVSGHRTSLLIYASLTTLTINFLVAWALIPAYGSVGAAIGTLAGAAAGSTVLFRLVSTRVMHVPTGRLIWKPVVIFAAMLVIMFAMRHMSWWLRTTVVCAAYLGALAATRVFTRNDILKVIEIVLRKRGRGRHGQHPQAEAPDADYQP